MQQTAIDARTGVGTVYLTVSDLARARDFYAGILGLGTLHRDGQAETLTVDGRRALFGLLENPAARPPPARATGLYHAAILTPDRAALARVLQRLLSVRYPLQGAADHLVSEALYLADPDGNGLEIYADRPRSAWPRRNGQIQMATDPLDVEGLLAEASSAPPWQGLDPASRMGHVHLQVSDLRQAQEFYCNVLGFDMMLRYGPSALFVSAGGYHHHIGMNTWNSLGAPPPPAHSVGLRYLTISLPDEAAYGQAVDRLQAAYVATRSVEGALLLRDPAGNGIVLTIGDATPAIHAAALS